MQEKGTRTACALPYELYTDGGLTDDLKNFELTMAAGNTVFGKNAAGSPFTVYSPAKFKDSDEETICKNWSFAVKAGDRLTYQWPLDKFENSQYHLRVNGPNGFYREFKGDKSTNLPKTSLSYHKASNNKLTGNVLVNLTNNSANPLSVIIADNAYGTKEIRKEIPAKSRVQVALNLEKSFNWYDFSVKLQGDSVFEQRFAGHVETGLATKTDPFMGRVV